MSNLLLVRSSGDAVSFTRCDGDDEADKTRRVLAAPGPGSTINMLRAAAWAEVGVMRDGSGRFRTDARTGHHNREAIKAIIRGDANPPQLERGVELLGRVNTRVQQMACAGMVNRIVRELQANCDASTAAKLVADASNAMGVRTDASLLGGAGAIKENLTLWAYRVFSQIPEVLHYRDLFVVDDGLDPFMLSIQLLFSLRTGEAKFSDGSASGSHQVGKRTFDELKLNVYGLIASDTVGYIEAGRSGIMGINAMSDAREALSNAMELSHDRLAIQGNSTDGTKILGLKNWPGIKALSTGYNLSNMSDAALLDIMNRATRRPTELSREKYEVGRLVVSNKVMTRLRAVTPGSAMAKSVLQIWGETPGNPPITEAHQLGSLWGTGVHAMVGLPVNPRVAPTYLRAPTVFLPEVNNGVSTTLYAIGATAGMYCESAIGVTVYTFGA